MFLKWGVAGCGRIANDQTIPALLRSRRSKLVAVMDVNGQAAKETAERFGVPRHYDDYERFLRDQDVEVVYIATPNCFHAPLAITAAEHGKHVLCEKPMAVNVEEAQRMVDAANRNGVRLMVAQMSRFNDYNVRAKEIVRSGALGQILMARSFFAFRFPEQAGWRTDLQISGGGALMDIGIYCVDTLRWLINSDVVAVRAIVRPLPEGHQVDMAVVGILEFANGALATFDCSFDYYSGGICLREVGLRGEGNGYQLCGTKGMLSVSETFSEQPGGHIWAIVDGQAVDLQAQPVNPYEMEMDYFVDCITTGAECMLDGQEGLEDVRILMAIYEAGRTGQRVVIH